MSELLLFFSNNVALVVVSLIVVVCVIIIILMAGYNVDVSKDGVNLSKGTHKKPKRKKKITPESALALLVSHVDLEKEIHRQEEHYLVRDCMNDAEEAIEYIVQKLKSEFLKLLVQHHEVPKNSVTESIQAKMYGILLSSVKYPFLSETRRMVHENGFTKKEETNMWESYVNSKKEKLINLIIQSVEVNYIIRLPSKTEVYDMHTKIFNMNGLDAPAQKIEDMVRNFLRHAKAKDEVVQELRNKQKEELKSIIGG